MQGIGGGEVGTKIWIEVAEDSDANGVAHGVIVLERFVRAGVVRLVEWCGFGLRAFGLGLSASGFAGGGVLDFGWSGDGGR